MKNRKKRKLWLILGISLFLVIVLIGVIYYISNSKNSYSFSEKKWLSDNRNESIDIVIEGDLPIFSFSGEGVFHDYTNTLEEDTGLKFNFISESETGYALQNKNTLGPNEIIFYKDHYVVLSKNKENISSLEELSGKNIGILNSDSSSIRHYLTGQPNLNLTTYDTFDEVITAYTNNEVSLIILPMFKNIKKILDNNLNISFHLDGLYSYYTLRLDSSKKELNGVMEKLLNRWQEKLKENINSYFLDIYYNTKDYTELEKESIINDDLIIGYIENIPYEGMIHKKFTGLTHTYLNKFSELTGATYKYLKYDNVDDLKNALANNKLDLVLNYYKITNPNYVSSIPLGGTEYVVLAHTDNKLVINSLYGLNSTSVEMLSSMNLNTHMVEKNLFNINSHASVETLLKIINNESIIIIEKEVYDYYKDSKLKNYNIRFIDNANLGNNFLLKTNNDAFNNLFNFFISTLSINEIKIESIEGIFATIKNNLVLGFILKYIWVILIALGVGGFVLYKYMHKIKLSKKIKREDRLLYLDVMTNLKNRNYLNDNIDYWENNKIYPQAVVILDLIKVKVINDKYGHEEGDKQIKAAASALIKTQRDNSEIMRTNGNEYLAYLVGYEEKTITSYIHKLNKELKHTLPYKDYGVAIGYSMITSELKTLDDAINEALIMVSENKRSSKEK